MISSPLIRALETANTIVEVTDCLRWLFGRNCVKGSADSIVDWAERNCFDDFHERCSHHLSLRMAGITAMII